ncbi:long-chain fatty acid--CoA ligase [Roseomonas sp. NAR14]|uniref:3-methylmercaptopropionyl-CoA ligase n=1 Tax=Roseomonas acroporae TaxID=2937791 RepID=A0A9X1Y7Y4_9PROT|nr:long-chain fatty acid--CoA ligase [Roseomonas acroporae]MCK8784762.1 long-chain fatty acid--CoA ligase [Roseomonas acroporae]
MYLTQCLHRGRQQQRDRVAVVSGGRRRSWAELADRAARAGTVLRGLGVQPGDRVAILAPNTDDWLDLAFGTWWIGGVVNPVNTRWSPAEIAFSLEDCETAVMVAHPSLLALAEAARTPGLRHLLRTGEAEGDAVPALEPLLRAAAPAEDLRQGGDALASLFYTGGTTGRPKGVMLSHRNMWSALVGRLADIPTGRERVQLHTAPLFHVAGFGGMLVQLHAGSTGVFLQNFDAVALMETIEREGVTDVMLVPTMLSALLEHPEFRPERLRTLRRLTYGAAPIPAALLDRAMALLPAIGFVQAYGMTENWAVAAFNPAENHLPENRHRLRVTGRAYCNTELRIADAEGNTVPHGTVGEVLVRGPHVMLGYWNRPEETRAALRDGWLHTGDAARMDADGYITVVDRLKDMIITGGENVYSAEVENAIGSHPGVRACAVIGVPHPHWGEAVHAVVVPHEGAALDEAAIRAHCRALIAGYKVPKSVEFRDALPLSKVGKVMKNELRAASLPRRTETTA